MWQMAFLLSYAKKHGLDYCVPTKVINPHISGKQEAYRFPGIIYHSDPPPLTIWNEPHFHYAEIPPMDNVCFVGYFQSWRYYDEYREDVLKAFGFPWKMNKGVVSLHYRAGDYKKWNDYHPIVSEEYIEKAVYYFAQRGYYNFLVFSDEIETIREILTKQDRFPAMIKFEYSEGKDEIEDLVAISCCQHHVCANSTFSWWGAWLNQNENKIIMMPQKWFGDKIQNDTKDLYLPTSVIL